VIVGVILALLIYLIDAIPLPELLQRVARIAIRAMGVLILIVLLPSVVGEAPRLKPG